MNEKTIILTQDLTKVYGRGDAEVRALVDVNVTISEGEFVAVMGPSGSGKSTLLRCINRLHDPTDGEVLFDVDSHKVDIVKLEDKKEIRWLRTKVGMIFQNPFNILSLLEFKI